MNNNFKRLCIVVCLGFQFGAVAQNKVGLSQYQSLFYGIDTVGVLDVSLGLDAQTSNHNFKYVHSLFTGKFISSQLINDNSNMLNLSNRAGFESVTGGRYLFASAKNKKENIAAHFINAKYKQIVGGQYNSDAWLLAMKGNAPFAGEQVTINQLGIAQFQWLEIGWGKKSWFRDDKIAVTYGINALGGKGNRFILEKGSIYTDTSGEYIDVVAKGNWLQSNSNGQSIGFGAHFGLQGIINEKTEWQFIIDDLGAFLPNKNTQSNEFDTAFRLTGFYIYDIKKMSENGYWTSKTDSLSAPISEPNGEKGLLGLPFKLTLAMNTFIKANQQLGFIIGYRHMVYAMPKVEAWHQIDYNSGVFINSNLAYGGWGGIQWSEKIGYQKQHWAFAFQFGGMQAMAIAGLPFQATAQVQLVARF